MHVFQTPEKVMIKQSKTKKVQRKRGEEERSVRPHMHVHICLRAYAFVIVFRMCSFTHFLERLFEFLQRRCVRAGAAPYMHFVELLIEQIRLFVPIRF